MNILIISESFIVRDSLNYLFKELFSESDIKLLYGASEFDINSYSNLDFVFIDTNIGRENAINIVNVCKDIFPKIKTVILDASKDKNLFLNLIKKGIDGYILNVTDKEEFIYIIKKVKSGKKFYDSELLQYTISANANMNNSNPQLTKREEHVLNYVCKGMSNKDIATSLSVTDYTIKKHVSSILNKFNLKNRQDIIIYARDNNIASDII